MITVYALGPAWESLDLSPFVVKLQTWLRMAGLPFESVTGDLRKLPRGKVPAVDLGDGELMTDSQRIIDHLSQLHGDPLGDLRLPAEVQQYGVKVDKKSSSILQVVVLRSPKGTHDSLFLSNYLLINIRDTISRISGVGQANLFGQQDYAMRIWVKPDQLTKLGLTVTDLMNAVQQQSAVNPAGQIGAEPAPKGQQFTYAVRAPGRLVNPEDFGNIPVWGFGEVIASRHPGISIGESLFGYFPMATHLVIEAADVSKRGLRDGAAHRQGVAPVYNAYARVSGDPAFAGRQGDYQALLRPLFMLSFLVDDFLGEHEFYGARSVILSSASSKTAFGLAHLLLWATRRGTPKV